MVDGVLAWVKNSLLVKNSEGVRRGLGGMFFLLGAVVWGLELEASLLGLGLGGTVVMRFARIGELRSEF